MKKEINLFMKKLRKRDDFDRVKFVILFGSQADGKAGPMSDFDFAVYYDGNDRERFDFRKSILGDVLDKFDVQVLQDLPLYVQKEVLKGKLIYTKDKSWLLHPLAMFLITLMYVIVFINHNS